MADPPRSDQTLTFLVDSTQEGGRLDTFLCDLTGQSRAQVQKHILKGLVRVNGEPEKKCRVLVDGDRVLLEPQAVELPDLEPRHVDFGILHEEEEFMVIDKPAGLSVHPAPGQRMTTLVHGLLHRSLTLSDSKDPWRPGIVHRLDRFTSGVLLVAKTARAHTALSKQFAEGLVNKEYWAVVEGLVEHDESLVNAPIARDKSRRERMAVVKSGKPAQTLFKVLKRFAKHTLLSAHPATGRRHQIRVHARHLGHPLVSDVVYSNRVTHPSIAAVMPRHALHALTLRFHHPLTGLPLDFSAPPPADFNALLTLLGGS